MYFARKGSFFFVVLQVDGAERYLHLHFVARLETFQTLLFHFPFRIQEPNLAVLEHFAFEIIVDIVLFLHDLDIFRTNEHTYFRARQVLMIILNQELISVRRQHAHLVMHAFEDTTLYLAVPFGEFPLRHPVLFIQIRLVRNNLPSL